MRPARVVKTCLLLSSWTFLVWMTLHVVKFNQVESHWKRPALSPDCNVTRFRLAVDFSDMSPSVPREYVSLCHSVFYNRLPKCASRTMRDVFEVLAPRHHFTAIFIDRTYTPDRAHLETYYLPRMKAANDSFTLTSHYYFLPFSRYYGDRPVYINVMREPSEWFKSMYFWAHFGSMEDKKGSANSNQKRRSGINACALSRGCVDSFRRRFGPIPFLCGNSQDCLRFGDAAVSRILNNLDREYLVVGLYEEIDAFGHVLEYLMPHMFSGFHDAFHTISASSKEKTRSVFKENLDPDAAAALRKQLAEEYVVYEYVKKKFRALHRTIKMLKTFEVT